MKSLLGKLAVGLAFVISLILFRYLGVVGLIFIGAYYLGDWIAKWYCKRPTVNEKVLTSFAWSNVVTWLLPPLGIFTASLAYGFSVYSQSKSNKKYRNLALIGAGLALLNAAIGILQRLG